MPLIIGLAITQLTNNPRITARVLALAVLLLVAASPLASAQSPFPIVVSFDPHRTIDTGADLTFAAVSALSLLEERAFTRVQPRARVSIPLGIAKTVLLDHPVAVFFLVLQHEAFGHGGRARELGGRATFTMGSPWTRDALFNGGTRFGGGARFELADGHTVAERRVIYAGGTEANSRAATLIARELVAGRTAQPMQLLYFVRSRWYPSQYVLRTPNPTTDPRGFFEESQGGDVATYLGDLSRERFGDSGITVDGVSPFVREQYDRLRRDALIALADPAAWLAWWTIARHSALGDSGSPIPTLRVMGRRFLPAVSADWLVDGGALSIETIFGPRADGSGTRWLSFVVRHGSGPSGPLWNAGGATEMFATIKALRLGGDFEVWNQPTSGAGGGITLRGVITSGRVRGLFVDAGVKADGHWPGRPINGGAFARVGYRYRVVY